MSALSYAKKHDFGIKQRFVRRYHKLANTALIRRGNNLLSEFSQLRTDVERVDYFLEILRSANDGKSLDGIFSQNYVRLLLKSDNGKSDYVSKVYLQHGVKSKEKDDYYMALYGLTKAVFHAASKESLALSLLERSDLLFLLGLYDEAIRDVKEALRNLKNRTEIVKARMTLGSCYRQLNQIRHAKREFKIVQKLLKSCENAEEEELRELALTAYIECKSPERIERTAQFVRRQPKRTKVKSSESSLVFKSARTANEWTTKVSRDIAPGEVIAESEPVGLILSANRTKYCYKCFKRCHNLLPCENCAQVGFCSKKCARRARENKRRGDFYPNRHKYDCNGLLPVIFNCTNVRNPKSLGRLNHTAFICIANTKPRRLLQFICSKRKYEKGKGHPAFFGIEEVRKTSPPLWHTSDYASTAWLNPYSNEWSSVNGTYGTMLLDFTVASVLLAYCLHLGGYPMDWNYSRSNRFSDKPPANWIAACLLYHLQSISVNSFAFCDIIRCDQVAKFEELSSPIYPAFSLINHSCDPSAIIIVTTNGVGLLIALKELKARSEISIAYYDIYTHRNTEDRREGLKNMFFFDCRCEACENGWDDDNAEEKIKCPQCNFGLELTEEACANCNSNLPQKEVDKVVRDFNTLVDNLPHVKWTKAEKRKLSSLISKVHSLILPPSRMATTLRMILFDMILETVQLWTYESWITNFYECNYFEESRDLREHRSLILD